MPPFRVLPAALALLVLAAHFYRAGLVFLVPACLGLVVLVFIRLAWVPRAITLALLLAAAEWMRTLVILASGRIDAGEPYARLAAILAGVAIATLLAVWPLRTQAARRWYSPES